MNNNTFYSNQHFFFLLLQRGRMVMDTHLLCSLNVFDYDLRCASQKSEFALINFRTENILCNYWWYESQQHNSACFAYKRLLNIDATITRKWNKAFSEPLTNQIRTFANDLRITCNSVKFLMRIYFQKKSELIELANTCWCSLFSSFTLVINFRTTIKKEMVESVGSTIFECCMTPSDVKSWTWLILTSSADDPFFLGKNVCLYFVRQRCAQHTRRVDPSEMNGRNDSKKYFFFCLRRCQV